jgi:O-acetyl-ADP-ribose deacetylase (regulator of RNase III)
MFIFETGELTPRLIINFPTKRHWRGKSRIEDIQSGLDALVEEIREHQIHSIAIPPLGSGLGGLDWSEVRPLVERALAKIADVDVLVFEPDGMASARPNRSTDVPRMTAGRAALVGLMDRYLGALMDPTISLLEVHKLMYFLQVAGEPLRLDYVKAPYGPYAQNLRHVLRAIDGHLIDGYADNGDAPGKQLKLVPGATADAEAFLEENSATRARFSRVVELVEGFETAYGLELLATVHWVVVQEGVTTPNDIETAVRGWSARKAQFTSAQVQLAADRLDAREWMNTRVQPSGTHETRR